MMELLTVAEAAAFLHVRPGTLDNWRTSVRSCGPKYVKVGKNILYDRLDLEKWIEAKKKEPTVDGELRKDKQQAKIKLRMRDTINLAKVRRGG